MLKKKYFRFAVFILLAVILLTYQSIRGESRMLDFPMYPLRIIEKGSSAFIKAVKDVFNSYILITGKEDENQHLLKRVVELQQERDKLLEARTENERLKAILKFTSERADDITTAEVFARDPTNWFQILWISKGKAHGIEKNMVAVTPLGPVGKVHRVFEKGANVILITDVNSSVAVRLQSSRIEGILEGRGDDRCNLKYVSKDADIQTGEKIITSGLDGIYPKGLLIGYVTAVKKEDVEAFQEIEVRPSQDLNTIEEVTLLKK